MGNTPCGGGALTEEEKQAQAISKQIDSQISKEKKSSNSEVKLLLLGAGESGKSTFAKQMQIIHKNGFSEEERMTQKPVIFSNIIDSIKKLVKAADRFKETMEGLEISKEAREGAEFVTKLDLTHDVELTAELLGYIKMLWADPAIQKVYERNNEFQLNDSADYFFKELDRIAAPDYVPSESDLLRLRKKTTGIIETQFSSGRLSFRMVDVGGQRNERKKWIHCFEGVTSIIFVTSLSEYDCVLEEDETTNRMRESLNLFEDIVNNQWFAHTPVILFLNKKDLFEKKIQKRDLRVCFKTYKGGKDYNVAVEYIKKRFVDCNKSADRFIYTHETCATDTNNARVVFNAVEDMILNALMRRAGL